MLTPWLDRPGTARLLSEWSEAADLDLAYFGTTADAAEIRDTAVAQPLLTATALFSAQDLPDVNVVCGHSVGELAALAVAGVLSPVDAIRLAAGRGRAMAEAAALAPTGMVAVLGGDEADVRVEVARLGLELATVNVRGQLVVGGPQPALDSLSVPGARVRPLAAAGAFHTSAMSTAVPALQSLVDGLSPRDARLPVIANADGKALTSGRELVQRLVAQLTGPVRFDLCLETIAGLRPTSVVELAPAGTLTAIAKRSLSPVAA